MRRLIGQTLMFYTSLLYQTFVGYPCSRLDELKRSERAVLIRFYFLVRSWCYIYIYVALKLSVYLAKRRAYLNVVLLRVSFIMWMFFQ